MTGIFVSSIGFTVVVTLLGTSIGLAITIALAIPFVWLTFVTARGVSHVERSRIAALLDVTIADGVPELRESTWLRRLSERMKCPSRWREILHHVLWVPVAAISFTVTAAAWAGSVALLALPVYLGNFPGDTAKFYFFEVGQGGAAVVAAAVGLLGFVFVVPAVTGASAWAELALGTALLGPRGDQLLRAEVGRLETRRSAAVDSAESERRRIERDLHDGAQQRLVALAASLGAAREKLTSHGDDAVSGDRDDATRLVIDAHEESKAALKEIRDLVRGIHPVILEDRGLDAALSAVVARSQVPVALDIDLGRDSSSAGHQRRLPAAVESAAYFIVSEALTNVARHASAQRAVVSIAAAAGRLVVEVRDDGVGGADASRGTGLQGLRDRVTGLGGTFHVMSPPGGPTTLLVELPCAS